jgi:type I restriction-modification system DNA methylase subunit
VGRIENGQFRAPRHIIRLMVEMTVPQPKDIICDPACGTAGFLVAAGEYLRERRPEILRDAKLKQHFHRGMFHGFDFDNTMLRIGSMNMLLHGVMEATLLYESPFTDLTPQGPDGIFTSTQVDELIEALDQIRATAVAA